MSVREAQLHVFLAQAPAHGWVALWHEEGVDMAHARSAGPEATFEELLRELGRTLDRDARWKAQRAGAVE